jgi:hypothetical protein
MRGKNPSEAFDRYRKGLITVEGMIGRLEPLAQHDPVEGHARRPGMTPDFQARAQSRQRHEIRIVVFDGTLFQHIAGVQREVAHRNRRIRDAVRFDRDIVDPGALVDRRHVRGAFAGRGCLRAADRD